MLDGKIRNFTYPPISRLLAWSKSIVSRSIASRCIASQCPGCDEAKGAGSFHDICADCLDNIRTTLKNVCSVCGRLLGFSYEIETGETYICGQCQESPPIYDQSRCALIYEGPVRKLIHQFKFRQAPYLADTLAKLGRDTIVPWISKQPEAVIIPVPLARARLASRGYNPAYLLARRYGAWAGLEVSEGNLRRIRNTPPQFGLKAAERKRNVKGAFKLISWEKLQGRTVIVFDDIMTTGATIEECVKEIRKAKPASVISALLCRAGDV